MTKPTKCVCAQRRLIWAFAANTCHFVGFVMRHASSLIRIFVVCMKKAWVHSYPLSAQWRLWSDWGVFVVRMKKAWVHSYPLSTRDLWAHNEDSDQTGQMPRLIWVFAGCTVILLVLPWGSSNVIYCTKKRVDFLSENKVPQNNSELVVFSFTFAFLFLCSQQVHAQQAEQWTFHIDITE